MSARAWGRVGEGPPGFIAESILPFLPETIMCQCRLTSNSFSAARRWDFTVWEANLFLFL